MDKTSIALVIQEVTRLKELHYVFIDIFKDKDIFRVTEQHVTINNRKHKPIKPHEGDIFAFASMVDVSKYFLKVMQGFKGDADIKIIQSKNAHRSFEFEYDKLMRTCKEIVNVIRTFFTYGSIFDPDDVPSGCFAKKLKKAKNNKKKKK